MVRGRQKGIKQGTGPSFAELLGIFSQFSISVTELVAGGLLDNSSNHNLLHFYLDSCINIEGCTTDLESSSRFTETHQSFYY